MAKKNVIINGNPYQDVEKVQIPLQEGGGNAVYMETSDATAAAADILTGKNAYANGALVPGAMPNNGAVNENITTAAQKVTIAEGYTEGGTVQISDDEQAKIVSGNIKAGTTILGVDGKTSIVDTEDADAAAGDLLEGKTAYVNGVKVTGTTTLPVISLSDGVLSIA